MQYVTIPKDISSVKKKFMFGMTKRQVFCFGGAFLIGVPAYLFFKFYLKAPSALAMLIMAVLTAPLIAFGIYYVNGIYLDELLKYMVHFFRSPRIRTYQSTNYYQQMMDAIEYQKCAKAIERATGRSIHEKRKAKRKKKII
ncbi:MAG: PrgI family protein [Ruminococcus sp.]